MIKAAALCIGAGILLSFSGYSRKMNAEFLSGATHVHKLRGLEEFLDKSNVPVVVHGVVGSTSPMENDDGSASVVYFMQTASLDFKTRTSIALAREYTWKVVERKEVPWYLEDNTARVNVNGYQEASGFVGILKKRNFTEPLKKHFESLLFMKDIKIPEDSECECCDHILEIGERLTVVGKAERDRDDAPTIGSVYQVFNGHINISDVVRDLERCSAYYETVSTFVTATGVVLLAVSVLQDGV